MPKNQEEHSPTDRGKITGHSEERVVSKSETPLSSAWGERRRVVQAAGLACVLVGGLIAGLAACNSRPEPPQVASRVVIPPPTEGALRWTNDPTLAFSPDGTHVAYLVFRGDGRQIYILDMASMESRPVPGTEGGDTPFFSPDGQWLGFFADGRLKKMAVSGGAAVTLTPEATNLRGASWGPNDTIVFNLTDSDVLFEVSAAGGEPQQLTKLNEGETSNRWPQFLPDGKAVVFTVALGGSPDDSQIAALRLETGERKVLVLGGTFGRYVPTSPSAGLRTGHLVYHRDGTIMAAPFDPARLEVLGTPAPVLEGVLGSPPDTQTGVAQFSFSNRGSLAYVPPEQQTAGTIQIHVVLNWFEELKQRVPTGN